MAFVPDPVIHDELRAKINGIRKSASGHLDIIAGQKGHLDQVDVDLLLAYVSRFHEELLQIQVLERLQRGA